jgi:hypothetical protein
MPMFARSWVGGSAIGSSVRKSLEIPAARRDHKEAVYEAEQIAGVLPILDLTVKALAETIRKFILDTIPH